MKNLKIALLSIIAVLTVKTAGAEAIPAGCYVSDTEREWFQSNFGYSVDCHYSSTNLYNWLTPAEVDDETLVQIYGPVVGMFIKRGYESAIAALQCDAAYKGLGQANTKQASLIKKLRKACGSKCRRIK